MSPSHPHRTSGNCVKSTIALAEDACAEAGVRLTKMRRQVLEIIAEAGAPIGAYAIIDRLAHTTGARPAPMTVYRALDFLIEHALVHRLASRNAYLACDHSHGHDETVVFLLCEACTYVGEIADTRLAGLIDAQGKAKCFTAQRRLIEVSGLCAACAVASNATQG
jgi:Fur family transcriptional regulator, zinc uptake regulator